MLYSCTYVATVGVKGLIRTSNAVVSQICVVDCACQALLNLGSSDPSLRSAAYNLLCTLTQTFDLKIEGQLLETAGTYQPLTV